MNMYVMGDYYVWHCDWCDSTNHTLWSRLNPDGLTCAACHRHHVPTGICPIDSRYPKLNRNQPVPNCIVY